MKNNFGELLVPLHLISLAPDSLSGKTRLQKLVFLSEKEFRSGFNFSFKKAQLGPLSYRLLEAVDELVELGMINRQKEVTNFGYPVFRYNITENGEKFLEFGREKSLLTDSIVNANQKVMEKYGNKRHVELLDYVHEEYPEYRLKT